MSELESTNSELVFAGDDGQPFTTSLVIAEQTDNQHESVIRIVRNNLADFEEFGGVRFEIGPLQTAGGTQQCTWAVLTEPQSALLISYMRNNDLVRDFKKRLVRGFYVMRTMLAAGLDLSDPLSAIENANTRTQQAVAIARGERARAEKAEATVEPHHLAGRRAMTKYLTVQEVADLIAPDGINKHMWAWRRMADGRIPGAIRIDRTHLVIPESKLLAWMASNTIEPETPEPLPVTEDAVIHGLSERVASRRMARTA